jgi:membrane-bound serine protease (ClpP class)
MSALLIFITINIALKIRKKAVTTGIQTIIGQPGLVLTNPEDEIQVRIGAEIWTATSSDELTAGDTIKVLEVNGMLLRVAKSVTE